MQADLSQPGALNALPDASFDVLSANDFLGHTYSPSTSPQLARTLKDGSAWISLEDPLYRAVEDELFAQALRLLRPGGIFVFNGENVYQKSLGEPPYIFVDRSHSSKRKEDLGLDRFRSDV
ncbi:MAG: hypothetical protein Q8P27_00975 [Candidatus Peregrinibacteria bacterium]|nr:hypothetical protein [Candidatus Peregrinibacteria bacterium]